MLRRVFITSLGLATVPFLGCRKAESVGNAPLKRGPRADNFVSLIALIANPDTFDGESVTVVGFLRLEFEGNGLYVSKADFDAGVSKNAVWVDPPANIREAELTNTYVLVEGTFSASSRGHLGLNSGTITKVIRLERWPSRVENQAEIDSIMKGQRAK